MPLIPIQAPPGIVKNNSDYTAGKSSGASGRYVDGDKVRFQSGFPEKIGGWTSVASGMVGIPRAVRCWRDVNGNPHAAIGTETHLYQWDGEALSDITPIRRTVTLAASPFATTLGSPIVTVTDVAHGATSGDYVTYTGATAVGGLTLTGEYRLTVLTVDAYTVTASGNASSTATGGGTPSAAYNITMQAATVTALPYGTGLYGAGTYGGASTTIIVNKFAGWTLFPYGGLMTAGAFGGGIYSYDVVAGGRATRIPNSPVAQFGHFVTPERFIVALGVDGISLRMSWCDQEDFTVWTSLPTNTANSGRTIQGGSYFVAGHPVRDGVSLVFSNRTVVAMTYQGDNYVYATPQISDNSGLISPFAAAVLGGIVYWMSDSEFWMWNGAVTPLPSSDIRDWVFSNMNPLYAWKCCAGVQRQHKEVWFFYCSASATEIDSYVIYHTDAACWSVGTLSRTALSDADLFSYPMAADPSGVLYFHENGWDANGSAMASSITFSPVDISNGDRSMDLFGFIPDFAYQAGIVNLTVNTRHFPQDTNAADGPYAITANDTTPRLDLRSDGKMIGYELESNELGGKYRVGVFRADAQPSGARR
jgi:hypothetical protein